MSTNVTRSSTAGPALHLSGIGTGIDTDSIVTALMNIERLPITRIQDDKKKIQAKQGVVQEINKLLTTLSAKAAALYAPNALQAKSATSADPAIATASVDSTAASGTYNVVVSALAQAHTMASGASPVLTAGQGLDITVGTATKSVAVKAGDTLAAFADRINTTTDIGVSASVINDKLVLISRTSGSGGAITVGGTAAAAFGFATTQPGQDAAATVNGLAVTSTGNTIDGAINGVDLSLAKVGSTTITVGADAAANGKAVSAFVDAYNALIKNINNATRYDAVTKTAGTLQGDQTMSSLGGKLRGMAGSAVDGLTGAYDSLSQLGITSSRDGTLTLDQGKLNAALAADPSAVLKVLGQDAPKEAAGLARQLKTFADTFSTDILSSRLTGFTQSLKRADDKISSLEVQMDLKEQRLRAQFTAMDTAVYQLQSQGADLSARLAAL